MRSAKVVYAMGLVLFPLFLFACSSDKLSGDGSVLLSGRAGTGVSLISAVIKPEHSQRFAVLANQPIVGTVEVYTKNGIILSTGDTDLNGNFSVSAFVGRDLFLKVTSLDGETIAKDYLPIVGSSGLSGVIVNAYTTAIVYVMEMHLGVQFGVAGGGYNGSKDISIILSQAERDSNITTLSSTVQADMGAGNASGLSDISQNIIASMLIDTEMPANMTLDNFIENGLDSVDSKNVLLNIAGADDSAIIGYYVSESSSVPDVDDSGWVAISPTASYTAAISFTLSAGIGEKTVYVWLKDRAKNLSQGKNDSIFLSVDDPSEPQDFLQPEVTGVSPENGSEDVAVNTIISLAFSTNMDAGRTELSFTISPEVAGAHAWSAEGTVLTFSPSFDLDYETEYVITINTSAMDTEGNTFAVPFHFSFTTGLVVDTTAPRIATVAPVGGSVDVNVNTAVVAIFSEAVDVSTLNNTTFALYGAALNIPGEISYSGNSATFTPLSQLAYSTEHTVVIKSGIKDMAGNLMTEGLTWSFTTVDNFLNVTRVTAGGSHACALFDDGSVKCWGWNGDGQLGQNDTFWRGDEPDEMGDILGSINLGSDKTALAITAGGYHTCALLNDGSVKCWGLNELGQLGQGDGNERGNESNEMGEHLLAVDLGTNRMALQVETGQRHSCAQLDDGSVKCWGWNNYGQLGLSNNRNQGDHLQEMGDGLSAIDFGTGRFAGQISAGASHTCALLDNSSVKCWGWNSFGQLGLGDIDSRGVEPDEMGDALPAVDLGTGRIIAQVVAGGFHTCALLDDGSVKCWGLNKFGQLGRGDTVNRGDEPGEMGDALAGVDLGTDRTARSISAGEYHTCAILDDGSVKCWGLNNFGQLGQGDTVNRGDGQDEMGDALAGVDLGTDRTARSITSGDSYTCALLDDGSVKCWGDNIYGQLGLGDIDSRGDEPDEMGETLPALDL